jgi:hypothetical protein
VGPTTRIVKSPLGVMLMQKSIAKDFFVDLRNGVRLQEMMRKYNLPEEKLHQILGRLRRSELVALRKLWERDKLSETEFMRAFEEVENELNGDD